MSLAKRILGAFIEVEEDKEEGITTLAANTEAKTNIATASAGYSGSGSDKFKQYFTNLFQEANMPGPDYFEFTKMVEAMKTVPEEQNRFNGAFAGLSVQGLDKAKLLSSANEYLTILDADAKNFNATIDATVNEKVQAKKIALDEKGKRIQDLTKEINFALSKPCTAKPAKAPLNLFDSSGTVFIASTILVNSKQSGPGIFAS